MTQEQFKTITERTNKALNFFADTADVDYCDGVGAAVVVELDKDHRGLVRLFPELRTMGY